MNALPPPSKSAAASYEAIAAKLASFDQAHLLRWWPELSAHDRDQLAGQIGEIDFGQLEKLAGQKVGSDTGAASRATAPHAIRLHERAPKYSLTAARERGEKLLRAGQVGMVLVAGGQGTRLGFNHPKGMFPLGPLSGRTLFEILIDKLRAVSRRYATRIPLLLMTSPATHDETIDFLAAHHRFGLAADDLIIFRQGTMPAMDAASGKLLLESKGSLALSPDGHGGLLAALAKEGVLQDLKERGIDELFYGQIDNPLLQVCDPTFLGYHALAESELSSQVVAKANAAERVGVVVELDGKLQLIEYSDFPKAETEKLAADGSLYHWAGSLAVHAMNVRFLERMAQAADSLPFHLARKKVAYLNDAGKLVQPAEPNALKFERFIFDLLPAARNALVVEVERAAAFAPVKNDDSATSDTPTTSRAAMCAQARAMLRSAGVSVDDSVAVEIHPLFAYDAEELRNQLGSGSTVVQPTYFAPVG